MQKKKKETLVHKTFWSLKFKHEDRSITKSRIIDP